MLMAFGHKRPLPPPESYSSVRQSCAIIADWDCIDSEEDLFVGASHKRRKLSSSQRARPELRGEKLPDNTNSNLEASLAASKTTYSPLTESSQLDVPKKRLFQTDSAWLSARNLINADSAKSWGDLEIRNEHSLPAQSKSTDPNSNSAHKVLPIRESDRDEADTLLRLTSTQAFLSKPAESLPDELDEADEIRRHEEKLGQSRSRLMRQEALAGRYTPASEKDPTVDISSSIRISPQHEAQEEDSSLPGDTTFEPSTLPADGVSRQQKKSPEQFRDESIPSYASETDIENDLDICQAFSEEFNAKFGQKHKIVHSNSNTQQYNPFSRTAAEAFRTQDRYLNNEHDPTISADTAGDPLERAKNRLLELRNMHQSKQLPRAEGLLNNPVEEATSDTWPAQGDVQYAISVPVNFDRLDAESQQAIIEHERLKERKKDLESVSLAMEGFAMLGSVKPFDIKEREWMTVVKKFLTKVVTEKRSGRRRRSGVKQITDTLQRRLSKRNAPDPNQAHSLFQALFPNFAKLVDAEMASLGDKIEHAKVLREEVRSRRANETKSARVRPSRSKKPSKTFHKTPPAGIHPNHTTASKVRISKSRQKAQYDFQDQKLAALRAQLSVFNLPKTLEHEDSFSSLHCSSPLDIEGYTSEEDEGALHYTGAGIVEQPTPPKSQNPSRDILGSNDHNNDIQSGREQNDEELTKKEISSGACLATSPTLAEPDVEHDADFDDTFSEDDTESIVDPDRLCYRYLVKEEYYNIVGHEENHQVISYKFLDVAEANAKVDEITSHFVGGYRCSDDYKKDRMIQFSSADSNEGLRDSRVRLGGSDVAGCHIWVDQEAYNPSKEAYENAKVRRACNSKPIYWVLWTKTLKPLEEEEGEENEGLMALGEDGQAHSNPTRDSFDTQACVNIEGTADLMVLDVDRFGSSNISETLNAGAESVGWDDDDLFGPEPLLFEVNIREAHRMYLNLNETLPIQAIDTSRWYTMRPITREVGADRASTIAVVAAAASSSSLLTTIAAAKEDTHEGERHGQDEEQKGRETDIFGRPHRAKPEIIDTTTNKPATTDLTRYPPSPPTTTTSSNSSNQLQAPASEPSFASRKLVQEVHFNDIQQFTTIATANRHAKDVFMTWYTGHLSAPGHQAFVRNEESHMEDELRDYGNMTMWSREEDFVVDVSQGRQQRQGAENRAIEIYKVWVERKMVRGPAN